MKRRESKKRKRHELAADSQSESRKTTSRTVTFETKSKTDALSNGGKATEKEADPVGQDKADEHLRSSINATSSKSSKI